jgi:MtrB/PioB family decaheme-associated outer membrane protein
MARGLLSLSVAAAVGALSLAGEARAQAVDTSDWVCEFCPFDEGYRADYDVGASVVDEDSAYFDNATGIGEEGTYLDLDGSGLLVSDELRWDWTLEDAGLDSRRVETGLSNQGVFDVRLGYSELPRREFFTTRSIYSENADGSLGLPAGWVRAGTTGAFTELDSSLVDRNIESDRKTLDFGARYLGTEGLSVSADYRRQQREGNNILGGSFYTNASLLPMPFDYTTDEVDLAVRYASDRGAVSLAWYLSDFRSDGTAFGWQHPFLTAPGAETSQLAQPPDNRFQQVTLTAGYRFDALASHINFSAATGRMEQQDASLLDYTTNANLDAGMPPLARLDGEVDTTRLALDFGARPFDKARVRLSYSYDERDNRTPQETWSRVITDTFLSGESELNLPFSYERSTLSGDASYELFRSLRLDAGIKYREIDRDLQEVAEQDETTGWGGFRWRPGDGFEIRAKGGTAKRDIDRYNEALAAEFGQNPILRKYNLAYRYREFGEVMIDGSLADGRLGISLTGRVSDDSYSESRLGLISGDERTLAGDLNWAVSDKSSVYLHAGVDSIESVQFGSELGGAADWQAFNEDEFVTVGGGLRFRQLGEKVDLELDFARSDGTSEIAIDSNSGGESRFPDLETTLDYVDAKLSYAYSDRLVLSARLRFQSFQAEDWALEGVDEAAIPTVLSLGADPYDDEIVIFGIGFRYIAGPAGSDN